MFMIDLGVGSHYSLLGVAPDASAKEIRQARARIVAELSKKMHFRSCKPDERRSLEERMSEINGIFEELANRERRETYNKKNPHLTFFVIRKVAAPAFEDREVRLHWLHRAIYEFLTAKGEKMDPLSDLERTDFTSDYTPNQLLERLLNRGR
jgi:curved DNA-binding protein CbpA